MAERDVALALNLLLRRLYFEHGKQPLRLRFEAISEGLSRARIMLVTPYYDDGTREPEIVKVDERSRSEREIENYRDYVMGKLGAWRAPQLLRQAFSERLGAFALTYLGLNTGSVREFGDFYRATTVSDGARVNRMISQLFRETCGRWYGEAETEYKSTTTWISEEFRDWPEFFRHGLDLATDGQGGEPIIRFVGYPDKALPNPLFMLRNIQLGASYRKAITHGDLNGRNILVDQDDRGWLIDFYHTRPSHALRDFCRLETTVLLELTDVFDLGLFDDIVIELARVRELSEEQHMDVELASSEIAGALRTVGHIRALAASTIGIMANTKEYFVICACNALKYAAFRDISTPRRRFAVLYATRMLESASRF